MKKIICVLFLLFSLSNNAAIQQKVILCGVCRDVEKKLPVSMKIMEKIGSLFVDYRIIVYENNSNDSTPQMLKKWAKANKKVLALSEIVPSAQLETDIINRLEKNDYFRPELIARARNIVLDKAMSDSYKEFEYLIWMDMDFIKEPSYEGIVEVFQTKREWDAVLAYGIDPGKDHWDWYAFRDYRCPIGSELLGNDWWYLPKKLVLNKNDEWYPVFSAFGGCGIYKKSSIKGCRYSALVTKDLANLSQKIIASNPSHPIIRKYLDDTQKLKNYLFIENPSHDLPNLLDKETGFITPDIPSEIVWRMSTFVYKYPSVCEHVPFHASMIMNGHDKIFINPRLIFQYWHGS